MTSLEITLFALALTGCTLATVGYLLSLLVKKIVLAKASTWILAAGFIFLTLNLLLAAVHSSGWDNFGSRHFLSIYAWAIAGIYLGLQFKTKTRLLGAFIAPFILLFLIAAAGQGSGKNLVPTQWQGWLTTLHLVLAIAGEALFVLASAAGAMFMIQNNLLKHKKPGKMGRLLPSLGDLDRINHLGLVVGISPVDAGYDRGRDLRRLCLGRPVACRSQSDLVFCRLDCLRLSAASASGHRLERVPDGGIILRGLPAFLIVGSGDQILLCNRA